MKRLLFAFVTLLSLSLTARAQELNAKVSINSQKISNTKGSEVFEELKTRIQDFLNDKQWTELQFKNEERINCSFNIQSSVCIILQIVRSVQIVLLNFPA